MSETRHTIGEAAMRSGLPVEEVHGRVWRGELPGVANPGGCLGTVSGETLEALVNEGKARRAAAVGQPVAPLARHHFQDYPIEQAAIELGISAREVEGLILKGELEGRYCAPRWVAVRRDSLESYRQRTGAKQA